MTQEKLNANYKKIVPIVGDTFSEAPLYVSLGMDSEYFELFDNVPQPEFQKSLEELALSKRTNWSVSGYLEDRSALLREFPEILAEKRVYHLGIDFNLPCGTTLNAPHDCEVVISEYEDGPGHYGGMVVLKTSTKEPFYMLFGHLNPIALPDIGTKFKKGQPFARIGDMSQNGGWFYHTHFQILTQRGYDEGWASKGYCTESALATIKDFCPDPFEFLD